ncbi:MAG: hypothetical protein ACQER9_04905 [Nanobdellota archaeon]
MAFHKNKIRLDSDDHVDGVSYVKEGLNLCRLPNDLICIGCCGFDFANKKDDKNLFLEAIESNSQEFLDSKDLDEFKNKHEHFDLNDCGLCRKVVFKDCIKNKRLPENFGKKELDLTCPLHPALNNGKEKRQGECDFNFMCLTQRKFLSEWSDITKKKFLDFVLKKDCDWFTYSKKMHDNSLLKEFYESIE